MAFSSLICLPEGEALSFSLGWVPLSSFKLPSGKPSPDPYLSLSLPTGAALAESAVGFILQQ